MSLANQLHPSPQQLQAFAQGRLPPEEMSGVESHVAACDSCCRHLEATPEDTLLLLAREAATLSFHAGQEERPVAPAAGIPAELVDHPRYRVLGLVGKGGMGAVYKAQHRLMERLVALKVISPEFLKNEAAVERFRREFRSAARLTHPNIVTAYDAEQAGNLHFLVMEFVEGLGLDQLVAQRGPLPIRQACHLVRQAALGLAHVHERGMVHRDIKPQNLMVGRKGQLKILDCGLARLASGAQEGVGEDQRDTRPGETSAGMVLGTPDYMAPEQTVDAAAADIRADIYSLGCTLYFALSGQPPFPQGSTMQKLMAHAQRDPQPIQSLRPEVSAELGQILKRMMAKDPQQRYQTPREVAEVLTPFAEGKSAAPMPAAPLPAPAALPLLEPLPVEALRTLPPIATTRAVPRAGMSRPPVRLGLAILGAVLLGVIGLALIPMCLPLLRPDPQPQPQPTPHGTSASGQLPRRVLLVIPRWGLWYPDFEGVKNALVRDHQIEVVTASSQVAASELVTAPGGRVGTALPDIPLDRSVRAADYGAIVFAGLQTGEYHPGSAKGDIVASLLSECDREQRLLAAICGGQKALAAHGRLTGKRVARSEYAQHSYELAGAIPQPTRVERDGRIITAAADVDAAALAAAIAKALQEPISTSP